MSAIVELALPGLGLVGVLTGVASMLLIDFAKENWKKRFRSQIRAAIAAQSLTYADLQHLAERWNQDRKAVLQSLRVLLGEALSGEEATLVDRTDPIRALLAAHQAREPFAELPENISLQLAAIAPALPSTSDAVPQLAASLSELYSSNLRDLARQKRLSWWGFVVGVLGLLSSLPSIYALFKS